MNIQLFSYFDHKKQIKGHPIIHAVSDGRFYVGLIVRVVRIIRIGNSGLCHDYSN